MKRSTSRRITKTASVMIILVLLIGGTIYFRTASNAESLDNRNLRELSRIGQGVEGRVNNLRRVLVNLAGNPDEIVSNKAKLIPHLSVVKNFDSQYGGIDSLSAGKTAFKTDLATSSLKLRHEPENGPGEGNDTIHASYDFESLRPTLSSEYMETIFLANDTGDIFIWETDRTGVRIHELAALDTLQFKDDRKIGGIGKSDILQTSIAGQDYRFYLLPIRIHLSEIQQDSVSNSEYAKWILGGLVPKSEYRQQSLSLDPNMALFLGFLVIAGFLIVPFVRIFTMGLKERLKLGNLLHLVIALIFGTGLAGLWLADAVHFSPLKTGIESKMNDTADQLALNIDNELKQAINELEKKTDSLKKLGGASVTSDSLEDDALDSIHMKDNIRFDSTGTYPFYHMVFWIDSTGEQIAKWTPRSNNTPRINVSQREYFRAIHQDRGWKQKFLTKQDSTSCGNLKVSKSGSPPYHVESIRSWTTGENLAAISIRWVYEDSTNKKANGVAAITTELASLTNPVLPPGVGYAVVDADAKTLFHIRPERILDENFAEETNNGDLLRSVLAARSCEELEMSYEGQTKLMVVRPLNDRPLFLILYKDLSLIDTVRFEAWFEGGGLLALWIFMILLLIFSLEQLPSSRMDWLWPDLEKPGKYSVFTIYSLPFIILFIVKALMEEHLHIHPTTLVIPVLYLGLGLVILSHGLASKSNSYRTSIGWALFAVSVLVMVWLTIRNGLETTGNELVATAISLAIILVWLGLPRLQMYINRWTINLSTRGTYTIAMVSGLLVLGLLPGYITYRITYHDHSEHLVKYHQLELAESLQNKQARVDELMQSIWKQENWRNLMTDSTELLEHNYDIAYNGLIFETKLQKQIISSESPDTAEHNSNEKGEETDLHNSMHDLLGDHIPFLTEASVKMRKLSAQQADRRWIPKHDSISLQLEAGEQESLILTSQLPRAGSWSDPWQIAVFMVITGFLFLIVYRVSRWVFFAHLEHSEPLTLEDILPVAGESWKSTILIGTRSISREPLFNRSPPDVHYIDLISDIDEPGDITKILEKPLPEETKVLCLDYFDHRIDEKERSRALLEFLEKNMTPDNTLPIMLFTSREPDESLLTAGIAENQKEEIKHRWDRVLGRFSRTILSDIVPEATFRIQLRLRIIQKIRNDLEKLLTDLNERYDKALSYKNTTKSNESLAKLALKNDWLCEELQNFTSPAKLITSEQKVVAENFKKRLEITLQEIEHFQKSLSRNKQITKKENEWLKMLASSTGKIYGQIDQIVLSPKSEMQPVQDRPKPGFLSIRFLKEVFQRGFTALEMEARREVYRDKKNTYRIYQTLVQECGQHQRLQEIGEQLTYRSDWHTLTKEETIDLVREGAEAHYRARWSILSEGERIIAAQLSRDAVVNPKSQQAISRLFARGLIRKRPDLRLDNKSFSDFVRNSVSEDQLHKWERAGIPSSWEMIRAPLVIALIVIALFLFWSQRELLGNTVTFLGTIGVGLGAIFNLLSKLGTVSGTPDLKTPEK